jgi:hypothetical protein
MPSPRYYGESPRGLGLARQERWRRAGLSARGTRGCLPPDACVLTIPQEPWASPAAKLASPSPASQRARVPLIKDKMIQKKSAKSKSIMPTGATLSRGVCVCACAWACGLVGVGTRECDAHTT